MSSSSRMTASAVVGGLVLLCLPAAVARAERAGQLRPVDARRVDRAPARSRAASRTSTARRSPAPSSRRSARRRRSPSAIAAAGSSCARCRPGRICCARTWPGSSPRAARSIDVRPSARASSSIALRHVSAADTPAPLSGARRRRRRGRPTRRAGAGADPADAADSRRDRRRRSQRLAWRLRHARRSVLKDATVPEEMLAEATRRPTSALRRPDVFGRVVDSSARSPRTSSPTRRSPVRSTC